MGGRTFDAGSVLPFTHHHFFKYESEQKPGRRVVQPDDRADVPAGAAVIPGTFALLLQKASAQVFHGKNAGHIEQSAHNPVETLEQDAQRAQQACSTVNGKHKNGGMTGGGRIPAPKCVKGCHQYFHTPSDDATFDKIIPKFFHIASMN